MEIKHHFISANINFNAVLLFNSTTERHLETSNLIIFNIDYPSMKASLIAQLVKNLPVMQKILVRFLGQEDLLEKGQATHSSILDWKILWTTQSMGSQSRTGVRDFHFHPFAR